MSTLATTAALGILTALTTAAIATTLARGTAQTDHLTPRGYDRAPADDQPGIRVNPGRPEGDL